MDIFPDFRTSLYGLLCNTEKQLKQSSSAALEWLQCIEGGSGWTVCKVTNSKMYFIVSAFGTSLSCYGKVFLDSYHNSQFFVTSCCLIMLRSWKFKDLGINISTITVISLYNLIRFRIETFSWIPFWDKLMYHKKVLLPNEVRAPKVYGYFEGWNQYNYLSV